jgi:hypothetical protein
LIQSPSFSTTYTEIMCNLQLSLDTWEGSLKATGGAIVPEKTYWQMIDFKWSAGNWAYKSIVKCPGSIYVNDIQGVRTELKRLESHQAETMLGVDLALDGNALQQANKMKDTAIKWADAMHTGKISRNEARLAIHSTIWRTLTYPLPCLNLSKAQCEAIMAPILWYGVPAMGICSYFPRKMVFAPIKYMGLRLQHLYTLQEIARLKDIIHHSFKHTTTGCLYITSFQLLTLEIGMGTSLHEIPFKKFANLATDSLVKSTWQFLCDHQIRLQHNIHFPLQRVGDIILMDYFCKQDTTTEEMSALNRCRLFLRAFHLSDIVDGSGTTITDDAWLGRLNTYQLRDESWPKQAPPTRNDWYIWRR